MGNAVSLCRKELSQAAAEAWKAWCAFWFEAQTTERLKLFRGLLGGLLFVFYLIRSLDLQTLFSRAGVVPLEAVPELLTMKWRESLFFYFSSDAALWAGNIALLAALLLLALGVFPRAAAIVAYVLHVSFLHRCMPACYGADAIGTFFLFYLCFVDFEARPGSKAAMINSVVCRLLQLQVCIIYFYSGLEKIKGPMWWGGEALWGVVSNIQIARWDFSWLAHFPLVLVAATYSTLLWEIYFPALVWAPRLRRAMLAFGVGLHLAIGLMVNIAFFGALMIVSYVSFLTEHEARALSARLVELPLLRPLRARRLTA